MFAHGLSRDSQSTPDCRRSTCSHLTETRSLHDYSGPKNIHGDGHHRDYSPVPGERASSQQVSRSSGKQPAVGLRQALESTKGQSDLHYDYLANDVQDALQRASWSRERDWRIREETGQGLTSHSSAGLVRATGDFRRASGSLHVMDQAPQPKPAEAEIKPMPIPVAGMLIQD
jgi:hypothetical protein